MKVIKSLNNNMVLAADDKGKDCICQGRGIGFKKSKGDNLQKDFVEKMYYPETRAESNRWQILFSEIPEDLLELGQSVVDDARNKYGIVVSDRVLLPICDHMMGAIERYKQGIILDNPMLDEIKKIYPKEYEAGKDAVRRLKDRYGIDMLDDEAAFLAYHFVIEGLGRGGK